MPYAAATHPFVAPPELGSGSGRVPVAIVGAGPVGMAMALDLAARGIRSVVLERSDTVGIGSKAICWAKRTLEIFDRLGCGERMRDKGVMWHVGKVYVGDDPEPVYRFDLLPEKGHAFPAFVNLQQYYVEEYLIERIAEEPLTEIRWLSEAAALEQRPDGAEVEVRTPGGDYRLEADYVLAADGSKSAVRRFLGLEFQGRVFKDHFLIADIKMEGEFPPERRFWFDPPNDAGNSALLHKQPDDVWRTDFQLGWDIDREEELKDENVARRVRALLGPEREFEFEWTSIYTFECRRLERFVHDRVIFIGDSAHLVSPFGARGGNGGIQDIDNLGWKLSLVLEGKADASLLETYNEERIAGADENILNSSRATDFMTPKNQASRDFRRAVLDLAADFPFARALVNSGRLSVPVVLEDSPLNTPDEDEFAGRMAPGAACLDAPVERDGEAAWLLPFLGGEFTLLVYDAPDAAAPDSTRLPVTLDRVDVVSAGAGAGALIDREGLVAERYDAEPGSAYLIRPDQHLAARWRAADPEKISRALRRAMGGGLH